MSHIITAIIMMSSVAFAENWSASLFNEISPSCRSRYQLERDIKELGNCIATNTEIFRNDDKLDASEICALDLTGCFRRLAVTVKPCLTDEKYNEKFGYPLKAAESGIDFACSYNGQPLQDFIDKGLPCLQFNSKIRQKSNKCFDDIPYDSRNEYLVFNSEEHCGKIIDLSKCLVDVLNMCEDKTGRNLFKDISLTMLNKTPCKNFTHELYIHMPKSLISTPTQAFAPSWTINTVLAAISASIIIILN